MKKLLGLLSVTVSLLVAALVLPLTGCGGDGDDDDDTGVDYSVTVQSLGKRGIPSVTVQAQLDGTAVNSAVTDKNGKAVLHMDPNEYTIVLSDLPKGYLQNTNEVKTENAQEPMPITISLASSVIQESAPADFAYTIGDVAYDFTLTSVAGETYVLSDLLETKRAVMLNFWATWCGPCVSEFPALIEAYGEYKDDLELIAVDVESDDSVADIRAFVEENGLTFPTVKGGDSFVSLFDAGVLSGGESAAGSIPLSVMIDRYGVVCFAHIGSMTSAEDVKDLFDQYTREDYVQDYDEVGQPGDSQVEREKPDVDMPASSEIEAAINNTGSGFNFTYYADEDEYSWPWLVSEKDGQPCIVPSNQGKTLSNAIIYTDVTVTNESTQVFAFDYIVSTEKDNDVVYVQVDGGLTHTLSGREENGGWKTCYAYIPIEEDTFSLSLTYHKDASGNSGDDTIYVKNMRFCTLANVESELNTSNSSLNFAYHCATKMNASENGYEHYINPVYNDTDKYYHVGAENGPLILVSLTFGYSHWSEKSVYQYVLEKIEALPAGQQPNANLKKIIEYCGYAGNSAYGGYTPVTQELLVSLNALIADVSETTYANQWLELCSYFIHYGVGEAPGDPIKGLANFSAYQGALGENSVVFDRIIVPRGLKFAFNPTEAGTGAGVYTVKSINNKDSAVWIYDEEGNVLCYADSGTGQENKNRGNQSDRDFRADVYMEANKTYYVSVAFDEVTEMGEFKFTIARTADSALVVTDCTAGIYTTKTDPITGDPTAEVILADAVTVHKAQDGFYYTENGERIYMDFANTVYTLSGSLYSGVQLHMFDFSASGGANYTSIITDYYNGRNAHGLVAVDQTLVTIIEQVGERYEWFFGGVDNPWLLFCYYYRYEGAEGTAPETTTDTPENGSTVVLPEVDD